MEGGRGAHIHKPQMKKKLCRFDIDSFNLTLNYCFLQFLMYLVLYKRKSSFEVIKIADEHELLLQFVRRDKQTGRQARVKSVSGAPTLCRRCQSQTSATTTSVRLPVSRPPNTNCVLEQNVNVLANKIAQLKQLFYL